jgi:uncharacterized protein YhaN
MRRRHDRLASSIEYYETRAAEQAERLSKLNRPRNYDEEDFRLGQDLGQDEMADEPQFTEEELRREEEEIRELEAKKRSLENRVTSMEKDITGVMR